jgi:transposase
VIAAHVPGPGHVKVKRRIEPHGGALGHPVPENAKARIIRLFGRLELVLDQIRAVESQRDTLVAAASEGAPEVMTKRLAELRGVGLQTATVLVRDGFVCPFCSAKALGSYAGLVGAPFASGGFSHEQGITKADNRRLRTAVVERAWLWLRCQPGSALSRWFAERLGQAGGRMRKVLIVALAQAPCGTLAPGHPGHCLRRQCAQAGMSKSTRLA